MARPLRIEYDGAWYHVMHRGGQRRCIFLTSVDRNSFFELLADIRETWNVEVHAYSLMDNHYHLLIHMPNSYLSRAMRHVDGVYTQRFNRAHKTDGTLFRGRFKAILVDKESYLLDLVRYIHMNPVKAGICSTPSGHRWTSHHAYLHPKRCPDWLVVDEVLSQFGKRRFDATNRFDRFVRAGSSDQLCKILSSKKLPSVLGSEAFKDWIKYNFIEQQKVSPEIPEARSAMRRKVSLREVMQFVQSAYAVDKRDIVTTGIPKRNEPRIMAIYLMRRVAGASHAEITKVMGSVSTSAIAKALQRFKAQIRANDKLREKVEVFTSNILSNVQT